MNEPELSYYFCTGTSAGRVLLHMDCKADFAFPKPRYRAHSGRCPPGPYYGASTIYLN